MCEKYLILNKFVQMSQSAPASPVRITLKRKLSDFFENSTKKSTKSLKINTYKRLKTDINELEDVEHLKDNTGTNIKFLDEFVSFNLSF